MGLRDAVSASPDWMKAKAKPNDRIKDERKTAGTMWVLDVNKDKQAVKLWTRRND